MVDVYTLMFIQFDVPCIRVLQLPTKVFKGEAEKTGGGGIRCYEIYTRLCLEHDYNI